MCSSSTNQLVFTFTFLKTYIYCHQRKLGFLLDHFRIPLIVDEIDTFFISSCADLFSFIFRGNKNKAFVIRSINYSMLSSNIKSFVSVHWHALVLIETPLGCTSFSVGRGRIQWAKVRVGHWNLIGLKMRQRDKQRKDTQNKWNNRRLLLAPLLASWHIKSIVCLLRGWGRVNQIQPPPYKRTAACKIRIPFRRGKTSYQTWLGKQFT